MTTTLTDLAPRRVLRAVVAGDVENLAPAGSTIATVWGCRAIARASLRSVTTRSDSVRLSAQRAARRALCHPPPGADTPSPTLDKQLDAWLHRIFLITVRAEGTEIPPTFGADLPPSISPHVSVRTAANEWGALMALLQRLWHDWQFPLTLAAEDACNVKDARKGSAVRKSPTSMTWPGTVWNNMQREPATTDKQRAMDAAISLSATIGSPVTMTRTLRVSELSPIMDKITKSTAVVVGFEPRPGGVGRKRSRRTLVTASLPTVWTGGSGPLIARVLMPWWRRMRDEGCTYLFPLFAPKSEEKYDGAKPIGERALQGHLRSRAEDDNASWHFLRRGVEHALESVHRHPEVGGEPIPMTVRNAITQRSNLPERGSRDSYINEIAGPICSATRNLYRMTGNLVGGMVVPTDDPDAARSKTDAPFTTRCAECDTHLGLDAPGSICDHDDCEWTLCTRCWREPVSVPLWCPRHTPEE